MAPTFVSPNQWPIFENWLMIRKDGFRYVVLKDGQGLTLRSTRHVRIVEITDSSDSAAKEVAQKDVDYFCTETAISKDEAISDEACRLNLEFVVPIGQSYMLMKLPKDARLFAILGRFAGEATVKAVDKRKEKAKLSLTVAETIKVPAAFHVVRHLSRGKKPFVPHSKKIDETSTRAALTLANTMLRQAAIKVEIHSFGNADIDLDLGNSVDLRKMKGPEVLAIRAKVDKSVEPNVFIAGRVWNNGGTSGSTFEDQDVIMDDHEDAHKFARTLAHELGHVFELGHVWPDPKKIVRVSQKGNVTKYHQPPTENLMGPGDEEGLNRKQIGQMRTRAGVLNKRRKK